MRKYLLFLVFAMVFVSGCADVPSDAECSYDQDCVPASCCHSDSCVPVGEAPNCEGMICTMECRLNTMDCGQGYCRCINNECKAVLR